jgi:predicted RNA-binding protein (virulence factor B family)
MKIGEINQLKVARKSDLGFMLTDDSKNEVLLHFREAKNEYKDGDMVKVFLYYDKKHRLCATENEPIVTLSKPGFVSVVETITGTGVFISNNCGKDLLVSILDK